MMVTAILDDGGDGARSNSTDHTAAEANGATGTDQTAAEDLDEGAGAGTHTPQASQPVDDPLAPREGGNLGEIHDPWWRPIAHWVVLGGAAAVDAINFKSVVGIVYPGEDDTSNYMIVTGFTVLALALAHRVGTAAWEKRENNQSPLSSRSAWLAFVAWLGMGAVAFVVRLLGGSSPSATILGQQYEVMPAALFLSLYLATGAVAAIAGFKLTDPNLRRYRRALRAEARATERKARDEARLAAVEAALAAVAGAKRRDDEMYAEAVNSGAAQIAERLRSELEIKIWGRASQSRGEQVPPAGRRRGTDPADTARGPGLGGQPDVTVYPAPPPRSG